MNYEIARKSGTGGTIGVYVGEDENDAMDSMAHDAGYKNFRDMCLIVDPRHMKKYRDRDDITDAELKDLFVEDERADYCIAKI